MPPTNADSVGKLRFHKMGKCQTETWNFVLPENKLD